MIFFLSLNIFLASVTAQESFSSVDNYEFRIVDDHYENHTEARKECQKMDADLAILRSKEQKNVLINLLERLKSGG